MKENLHKYSYMYPSVINEDGLSGDPGNTIQYEMNDQELENSKLKILNQNIEDPSMRSGEKMKLLSG